MISRTHLLVACATLGLAIPGAFMAARLAAAQNAIQSGRARLMAAQADADELARLRQLQPTVDAGANEAQLMGVVQSALTNATISSSAFEQVSITSTQDGQETGSQKVRRRQASLILRQLAPSELGAFLEAWRRLGGAWAVASVELQADPNRPGFYRVSMLLSAEVPAPTGGAS